MDYEQSWNDMKRWLESGIKYLESRQEELNGKAHQVYSYQEQHRIKGKLEGMKTSLHHMSESEKIYSNLEDE